MHIAVAGNIGSGKTTLTELLSKHYNWEPNYEDVDDNPYLNDFYEDMQRWSFNLQIYFLNSRFNQILDIRKQGKTVIQDRTIYEDAYIFAPNLHSMGLMSTSDFENYFTLFNLMSSLVSHPTCLFTCGPQCPHWCTRYRNVAANMKTTSRLDYLKRLNETL
jgi:deoxyadenosine/deoxycytidine kinase